MAINELFSGPPAAATMQSRAISHLLSSQALKQNKDLAVSELLTYGSISSMMRQKGDKEYAEILTSVRVGHIHEAPRQQDRQCLLLSHPETVRLHQIRRHVSREVLKQLVTSLVLSRLDYCNAILGGILCTLKWY